MKYIFNFIKFITESYDPEREKKRQQIMDNSRKAMEKRLKERSEKMKQYWKEWELQSHNDKFNGGDYVRLNTKGFVTAREEGANPNKVEKIIYGVVRYAGSNFVRVIWHIASNKTDETILKDKWFNDELKKIEIKDIKSTPPDDMDLDF